MPVSTIAGVQQSMISGNQWPETWILSFTFPASQAALTATYGSIQRYAGGLAVNTASVPFSLPPSQSALVHDIYVSGAPSQDALLDVLINDIPQRKGVLLSSSNAQIAGRKTILAFEIEKGAPFRFVAYNTTTIGSSAVTQTVYVDVLITQS
jgi:hypothetical protein